MWYVKHYVPEWIPCPDGNQGPGLQVYRSTPRPKRAWPNGAPNLWLGEDETTGESGNCGRNSSLVLNLPVKITKID